MSFGLSITKVSERCKLNRTYREMAAALYSLKFRHWEQLLRTTKGKRILWAASL
jgi:hypothetical protein